jgi:hypothetical protein
MDKPKKLPPSPYHDRKDKFILLMTEITEAHFELVKSQKWDDAKKTRPFIFVCLN